MMAAFTSRFASVTALAAAFSMVATPVAAAQLPGPARAQSPVPAASDWSVEDETAQRHRGYRGGGYGGGGYGGSWGRHHHGNGIDTGDVLAGVLILGGIAAIASAASQNNRDQREPRDEPYRQNDNSGPRFESQGLDRAADMCLREVERDNRVARVEGVERTGDGWRVEGTLDGGRNFSCTIDNNGRIGTVDLDAKISATQPQWDDDSYAQARNRQDSGTDDADPADEG